MSWNIILSSPSSFRLLIKTCNSKHVNFELKRSEFSWFLKANYMSSDSVHMFSAEYACDFVSHNKSKTDPTNVYIGANVAELASFLSTFKNNQMAILQPLNGSIILRVHEPEPEATQHYKMFKFIDPVTPKDQLDRFLAKCPGFSYATVFLLKVQDIKLFCAKPERTGKRL